jgi:hypothetical protein
VLIAAVVFFLAAAAICVFAAWRALRQIAAIRSVPTSSIGMADDGYRKIEGHAEAIGGLHLHAPLTGSPCVWYHMRVEQWAAPTSEPGGWTTARESTSSAPFFVRDATGVSTVFPLDAEVTPSDKSQWYGSTLVPTDRNPPRLSPLESSQPLTEGNARYKYFEERIYADHALTVVGEFRSGRFEASPGNDDDLDDEIGDAVESADSDDAMTDKLETIARSTTRARISAGSRQKPFIVTTQLEALHVATSKMGSEAALAMGAGLAGVAIWLLWVRFG